MEIRDAKTTGESKSNRPRIRTVTKMLFLGAGVAAGGLTYFGVTHASADFHSITVSDARCTVAYSGPPAPSNGYTVSIEAMLSCATPPSSVHLVVQLLYRADPSKQWANVGTPGLVAAPPGKIAPANYLWADAPCRVGEYKAVYTLSGTARAAEQVAGPKEGTDVSTVKDGECS